MLIGVGVGFLSGLLGKGGSALASPLLAAVGVPPLIAVASPLPATVPATLAASVPYWRDRWMDRRVVLWSIAVGLPATLVGAVATRWIDGSMLIKATDLLIAALGHVDWRLVGVFALASMPFANLGARVALRVPAGALERFYGVLLAVLGGTFLLLG